jgi:hypothetical protein
VEVISTITITTPYILYISTYMKITPFPGNTRECNFEYFRVREGPNYFVSYYKNSSRLHYDPKECWRVLGVAKFTDTGKALKEWAVEMFESNLPKLEPVADTSFASEAMADEEEPTRTII